MATQIQGYYFDGDPDGINFFWKLNTAELATIAYAVDNKGDAHVIDTYNQYHYEITKSSEGSYVISKV